MAFMNYPKLNLYQYEDALNQQPTEDDLEKQAYREALMQYVSKPQMPKEANITDVYSMAKEGAGAGTSTLGKIAGGVGGALAGLTGYLNSAQGQKLFAGLVGQRDKSTGMGLLGQANEEKARQEAYKQALLEAEAKRQEGLAGLVSNIEASKRQAEALNSQITQSQITNLLKQQEMAQQLSERQQKIELEKEKHKSDVKSDTAKRGLDYLRQLTAGEKNVTITPEAYEASQEGAPVKKVKSGGFLGLGGTAKIVPSKRKQFGEK